MPPWCPGARLLDCHREWCVVRDSGPEVAEGDRCSQAHGSKETSDGLQPGAGQQTDKKKQHLIPAVRLLFFFFSVITSPIQCRRKSNVSASALFYVKASRNVVGWSFGFKSLGVLCRGEDRLLVLVGFIANYGSSALQPGFLLLWSTLLQCLF